MSARYCPVCLGTLRGTKYLVHIKCRAGVPDAMKLARSEFIAATTRTAGKKSIVIRQPMPGVTWETLLEEKP